MYSVVPVCKKVNDVDITVLIDCLDSHPQNEGAGALPAIMYWWGLTFNTPSIRATQKLVLKRIKRILKKKLRSLTYGDRLRA